MKLLIFTQVIDQDDLVLGFFHEWVRELAKHFEKVSVVCLKEGRHSLPANVSVYSLGKEKNSLRLTRAFRVLYYSCKLRHEYDAVFVHMNQEYVLLAGWLWKRLGKKIYLWRNHYAGNKLTDRAASVCDKIFCTSKFSYTAKFPKTVLMPVGVDTKLYCRLSDIPRDPRAILFYARMAPSKNPEVLLEALAILSQKQIDFSADFYGSPQPSDKAYADSLLVKVKDMGLEKKVRFLPGQPHREGPKIFNSYALFVNTSRSGMYDKTILEAAACESIVIAASKDFAEIAPKECIFAESDAGDLAKKLDALLHMPLLEQQGLASQMHNIAESQSLEKLGQRLFAEMNA